MPRETLACLLGLAMLVHWIYGNGEVAVLEQMTCGEPVAVPEAYRPIIRWTAQQFEAEHQCFLSARPKTLRFHIDGLGEVLFCHATPRSENEIFRERTPQERVVPIFEGLDASLVVCGQTHMQFDRMIGSTRVVNAGSVGMPFGDAGADWLLLGPDIQLRHTPYDLTSAAERILNTTYPQAQYFAEHNVVQPPSETEMLEVFTRAELR